MLKIDVNKSGRVFDFLVNSGMLILQYDPMAKIPEKEPSIILGMEIDRPSLTEVRVNGTM
jgi:transcriptional adapter 2-alpha